MVMLVSLQQANDQLRRDTSDDDDSLSLMIKGASRAVLNYIQDHSFLDSSGEPFENSDGTYDVPEPIQNAVLIIIGMLYKDRDGQDFIDKSDTERLGRIILPRTVHFLLDPYRLPTVI